MNGIPSALADAWKSFNQGDDATLGPVGETWTDDAPVAADIDHAPTGGPVGETWTDDAQVAADFDHAPTGGPVGETGTADAQVAAANDDARDIPPPSTSVIYMILN